ncbi:MAG: hypothetical protein C5B49_09475 [Bdellovibrio sp.]|nr:MAG: hypothetical protein C5B49_09475 [Bdellovibrio sp.]
MVDRTTLLEEEAGGTWPDLEAQWKRSQVKNAPSSDLHSEASARQKRLTRVLEPDAAPLNEENKGSKR